MDLSKSDSYIDIIYAKTCATTKISTVAGYHVVLATLLLPYPLSLISTFVVHCPDSIILLVSISQISSLYLVSVAEQGNLCLTRSATPKTGFLVTRLILKLSFDNNSNNFFLLSANYKHRSIFHADDMSGMLGN